MKESPVYQEWVRAAEMRGIQLGQQQGIQLGQQEGIQRERDYTLRLLRRKLGSLSSTSEARIKALPIDQLEDLGEALLDFGSVQDLIQWLDHH
ncbi:MAG: DUF4351 domain-containing protein [Cyanophyceae cyanobacterium]